MQLVGKKMCQGANFACAIIISILLALSIFSSSSDIIKRANRWGQYHSQLASLLFSVLWLFDPSYCLTFAFLSLRSQWHNASRHSAPKSELLTYQVSDVATEILHTIPQSNCLLSGSVPTFPTRITLFMPAILITLR